MSLRLTGEPIDQEIDVVEVHGDLDLASAPTLKRRLRNAIDEGWRRVVVDLTNVTYLSIVAKHFPSSLLQLNKTRRGLIRHRVDIRKSN